MKMPKLLLAFLLALIETALLSRNAESAEIDIAYEKFLLKYNKETPSTSQYEFRKSIFARNFLKIAQINAENRPYKLEANFFADLTDDEYQKLYHKSHRKTQNLKMPPNLFYKLNMSLAINWADTDKVSPIQDQGNCASCWTFASASIVESTIAIFYNRSVIKLSEQEIVDCVRTNYSHGCNAGEPVEALKHAKDIGFALASDYPYLAYDDICNKATPRPGKIKDFVNITMGNITDMERIINTRTFRVAVDSDTYNFKYYKSGVVTDGCPADDLDHDVVVVGAGTEKNIPYWLVRNSYGRNWGDNGYIKISRENANNGLGVCGIAAYPNYIVMQ